MSAETAEETVKWGLILVVLVLLGTYASKATAAIGDFLGSLNQMLGGDKVAKIDPKTGLPIDPATGKPSLLNQRTAPTPDQAAAIRATFDSTSGSTSGNAPDSMDETQMDPGTMAGFTA